MSENTLLPLLRASNHRSVKCMVARMPENFNLAKQKTSLKGRHLTVTKKVKTNDGVPIPQKYEYTIEDHEDRHPITKQISTFKGEPVTETSHYAVLVKKKDFVEIHLVDSVITFKKQLNLVSKPIDPLLKSRRGRNSKEQMMYGTSIRTAEKEEVMEEEVDDDLAEKKNKLKKKHLEEEGSEEESEDEEVEEEKREVMFDSEFKKVAKNKGIDIKDDDDDDEAKPNQNASTTKTKGKADDSKADKKDYDDASDLSVVDFSDEFDEP